MKTRKLIAIYLILFTVIALVALDVARAGAQAELIDVNEHLGIEKITGRSPAFTQPIALLYGSDYRAVATLEMGTILRDRGATYCDLVLLSLENSVTSSPVRLFAYCLQLVPSERAFPTAEANYELTTERVSPELLAVLERIAQMEGQGDYAAQLAVWRAYWGLSLTELQARLGAQDLQSYASVIETYLSPPAATLPPDLPSNISKKNIPAAANAVPTWHDESIEGSTFAALFSSRTWNWHDAARWLPLGFVVSIVVCWLFLEQRQPRLIFVSEEGEYTPVNLEISPPDSVRKATRDSSISKSTLSLLPSATVAVSPESVGENENRGTKEVTLPEYEVVLDSDELVQKPTLIDNRYRLEEWVGTWGLHDVYRVCDASTQAMYLMKVTSAQKAHALRREFEISGTLNNRHFLRPHRLGVDDGWGTYLLLDDASVQSLGTYVRQRGRFSVKETLAVAKQIGEALTYLHHAGLVHSALSPESILLTTSGEVYLTNLSHVIPSGSVTPISPYAKESEVSVDVVEYAAPEMAVPIPVDPTVDVYALGAVLYYLLTGESAKRVPQAAQILMRYVDNAGLITVIMKCLHKQPRRRYQNVTDVLQRLTIFQHSARRERSAVSNQLSVAFR